MKTYYDLLTLEPSAPAEEIKRAFRREIARYHPDKVQHLGSEFQEIAASRAASLTEAYRILMDGDLRRRYDESLSDGGDTPEPPPPREPGKPAPQAEAPQPQAPAAPVPPVDRRFSQDRASGHDFLRRAVLARVGTALASLSALPLTIQGFDAAFAIKGRKALFKKPEPNVKLLLRIVPLVDGAAVEDAWMPAARAGTANETLCLLLLGSGMAAARDLAATISEMRRKSRQAGPLLIPVDMRDWDALLPPETPMAVRSLLERLRQGD